MRFANLSQGVF